MSCCDPATEPEASPNVVLAAGAAMGVGIPMLVGALRGAFGDDEPANAMAHGGMVMGGGDPSWLGPTAWFYGAMALVLAAGFLHSIIWSEGRSCGSTPLGMGLMWGAMFAMALGMAVGTS